MRTMESVVHRLVLGIVLAGSCVWAEPPLPEPQSNPAMAKIRSGLPTGWSCQGDRGCVVISRDEPVTQLNMLSLPSMEPERLLRSLRAQVRSVDVWSPLSRNCGSGCPRTRTILATRPEDGRAAATAPVLASAETGCTIGGQLSSRPPRDGRENAITSRKHPRN